MADYVYLSIGSNIGNGPVNCKKAVQEIGKVDGIEVIVVSSLYETTPVGFQKQADFTNMALKIKTAIAPVKLLGIFKEIEDNMGRTESFQWGPRIIDIDIILYGNKIVDEEALRIPHPLMLERSFVMIPLSEIAGEVPHPLDGRKISELLSHFSTRDKVKKLYDD